MLIVKCYAYWSSKSKAILASAADSLVDIASQLVIAYAEYKVSALQQTAMHRQLPHALGKVDHMWPPLSYCTYKAASIALCPVL